MGIDTDLGSQRAHSAIDNKTTNPQTRTGSNEPLQRTRSRAMERETGIEPASLAWKAKVLPLNYSRGSLPPPTAPPTRRGTQARRVQLVSRMPARPNRTQSTRFHSRSASSLRFWWRRLDSNQRRRKPTDLQSAPFSHSGTPPRRRAGEYSKGSANWTSRAASEIKDVDLRPVALPAAAVTSGSSARLGGAEPATRWRG